MTPWSARLKLRSVSYDADEKYNRMYEIKNVGEYVNERKRDIRPSSS